MDNFLSIIPYLGLIAGYATFVALLIVLAYVPIPPIAFFSNIFNAMIYPLAILNPILPVVEILTCIKWSIIFLTGFLVVKGLTWVASFINPRFGSMYNYRGNTQT